MGKQIAEDLDRIFKQILHIGGLVEEAVDGSLAALLDGDVDAARAVIEGDTAIDDLELQVEQSCLDVLALRQPVAIDLRLVTAIMKINSDLERIGDLAVNIAERSEVLAAVESLPFRPDVSRMAAVTKQMVRKGLDALVRRDTALALRVWQMDVEPDSLYREVIGEAAAFMQQNPSRIGDTLHLLGALRMLERIADHATNIAEDVIFMVEGKIVRHRLAGMAHGQEPEGGEKPPGAGD
ncbi:MAG: phosphate signaling complex protein PhoU [Planctomycetes bacterium]|nr:phosphate signaling complex protein PhoU [Planctomycetota bacterium]